MKRRDTLLFIKIPFLAIPVILTILNCCTDWLDVEGVPLYWIFMGSWLLTWLIGLCVDWADGRGKRREAWQKKWKDRRIAAILAGKQKPRFASFYFGYYVPDKKKCDVEKFTQGFQIISRGELPSMPADKVGYMEWHDGPGCMGYYLMQDMNRLGLGVEIHNYSISTAELVQKLNRIITIKGFPIPKLTSAVITDRDSEAVRQKRNAGYNVTDNDVNAAWDILAEQGYALVNVLGEGLNLCLTIVTAQEAAELAELEQR